MACAWLGLAYNLKTFPENEVQKGKYQMMQKKLDQLKYEPRTQVDGGGVVGWKVTTTKNGS